MIMRITREMAEDAAKKMASKAYGSKISDTNRKILQLGQRLAMKEIPKELIECAEKYSNYIYTTKNIVISTDNCYPIYIETEHEFPTLKCGSYKVGKGDYEKAKELLESKKRLIELRDHLRDRISKILVAIRTYSNVKRDFPEALPFLSVKENNLPALQIDDLRNIFKNN